MIRRLSWIFAAAAWLVPLVLLLWQWLSVGQSQALSSEGAFNMWKMSVLVVDLSLAGLLSFLSVLLGAVALARTPENAIKHPGRRMLELLLLALPLLLCLFVMGVLLVH